MQMNREKFFLITISVALCGLTACKDTGSHSAGGEVHRHFIETAFIDSSVKPSDDFYRFVNGKWMDTAKIPADRPVAGVAADVYYRIQDHLKTILEDAAKSHGKTGSLEQQVGDFYASGMDTATINQRGYAPVKPLLAQIDAIADVPALMKFVAAQQRNEVETLIKISVSPDQKNSAVNIAVLTQAGIGLQDRDYYFKADSATVAIQNAYKKYLTTLFQLIGTDPAATAKNTAIVYAIEKDMARAHKTQVALRDVKTNYNKVTLSKIEKEQPNIGWAAFFNNIGASVDSADMEQPAYYNRLNILLKSVPLSNWKIYLKAHILTAYANALSQPFQDAAFNYYKIITGQQKPRPRWERVAMGADDKLGEALGQLYVKKYFPPEAKQRMDTLVTNLVKAFSARIQKLDWMSDSTKAVAQDKLKAVRRKIGYPDKWRDYSKVEIDRSKYFENRVTCNRNNFDFQLSQLGKAVDRTLWYMTPPTLNAYYNPTANDINFPAGILQYPLFDRDADEAVNYGGIGMVIGHEMTHGFDDQGAQYDKAGNIHDWWTKDDKIKFDERVKQIQRLYDGFTVLDSIHINGSLTTGENIADLGGIAIAYDAFRMTPEGQDTARLGGFTPDQRFFISFAQVWRIKYTDAIERANITLDPHAPARWRVLGPLMNFDPFYRAFNVQPGDKMWLDEKDRIRIW
jgi:putative endopeptidase